MRHRSWIVGVAGWGIVATATALGAACGGAPIENPVVPIATVRGTTPDTTPSSIATSPPPVVERDMLASVLLDASRALVAVVRGEPHDPRFDCQDPTADLRATKHDVAGSFARSGSSADVVLVGLSGFKLVSPAPGGSYEFRGDIGVWPDGRVRFGSIHSSLLQRDATDGEVPVDSLPEPLRRIAMDIVMRLTQGCRLATITAEEIASLPLGKGERESGLETVAKDAERIRAACRDAARATGPWHVRAKELHVIVGTVGHLTMLQASTRLESDHLCLGPVEAEHMGDH